ncbi:hypothetical protein [Elstera litoralis]|uniref:hypothetical protein n=1 Tax=Elstera litoralis TaxID=552518 RepID=UPI0006960A1D|nr:hypothetical protein [Elstera litoralis]
MPFQHFARRPIRQHGFGDAVEIAIDLVQPAREHGGDDRQIIPAQAAIGPRQARVNLSFGLTQ